MVVDYKFDFILENALNIAKEKKSEYVGVEHCLLVCLNLHNSFLLSMIEDLKINKIQFLQSLHSLIPKGVSENSGPEYTEQMKHMKAGNEKEFIQSLLENNNPVFAFLRLKYEIQENEIVDCLNSKPLTQQRHFNPKIPLLNELGRNISDLARRGKLYPVIGREKELDQLFEILLSAKTSNVLLIGEAGVGKTAIVEGLARHIFEKRVPTDFTDKIIIELSVSRIMEQTAFRSQLESKLNGIIGELQNNPHIILFIDEIHMIMGAGATMGDASNTISNILKPALGRNEICVIGATTFLEYKLHMEKDSAVTRRFKLLQVNEPDEKTTLRILEAWTEDVLYPYHKVKIGPQALSMTVQLAKEYLPRQKLPDSAINILDEACAHCRLKNTQALSEVDIRNKIADVTGIDYIRGVADRASRILKAEEMLSKKVIGQDRAVKRIFDKVKKAYAGFDYGDKPLAVFLFYGPSGVGKTFCARKLAELLFGTEDKLLTINMNEYTHSSSVSQLIGSSKGLVGHEEGGILTEFIKNNPFSIILLDEIEKADKAVWNFFLHLFDSSPKLNDTRTGRVVHANNVIFIMTTNIVQTVESGIGFQAERTEKIIEQNMSDYGFSPELLSRVQDYIQFERLSDESLKRVLKNELIKLGNLLSAKQLELLWTEECIQYILNAAGKKKDNVRLVLNELDRRVNVPLSSMQINGLFKEKKAVRVTVHNGELQLNPE